MRLLQLVSGETTRTCNLVDLGLLGIDEDRPQRVNAVPLLRPGAWHTTSQGAGPASYRMRGEMPLPPVPGHAEAATALGQLELIRASTAVATYIDRTVTPGTGGGPPTVTDVSIARVLIARWTLADEDLRDGRPYGSRRWTLRLQAV